METSEAFVLLRRKLRRLAIHKHIFGFMTSRGLPFAGDTAVATQGNQRGNLILGLGRETVCHDPHRNDTAVTSPTRQDDALSRIITQ